jgi:hypothetical protein
LKINWLGLVGSKVRPKAGVNIEVAALIAHMDVSKQLVFFGRIGRKF